MITSFSFDSVTKKQILENEYVVICIDKKEVELLDLSRVSKIFNLLKELRTKACRKLVITFDGYDDTLEEIYEIMQIREYVLKLFSKYPYMFYYIATFDLNMKILLACISDVEKKSDIKNNVAKNINEILFTGKDIVPVQFKYVTPLDVLIKMIFSTMKYCSEIGETEENTMCLINELINPALGPTSNIEIFEVVKSMKNDLYNIFSGLSKEMWNVWIKESPVKIFISEKQIHLFAANNQRLLSDEIEKTQIIRQISIGQKYTNLFVYKNLTCDKCGEKIFLIIKKEVKQEDTIPEFLPDITEYIKRNITPFNLEYRKNMPVPINKIVDKKFCMKCRAVSNI